MIILILFTLGLVTSFIGTNVGGAAALVVPGLMFLGLSPATAIGTTRFSAFALLIPAWFKFGRGVDLPYKMAFRTTLVAMGGALCGSYFVQFFSPFAVKLMLFAVYLTSIWVVCSKQKVGIEGFSSTPVMQFIGTCLFFFVGFWGGSVGGGYAVASHTLLTALFGATMLQSAGINAILGLGISIVSVPVFVLQSHVDWNYIVPLAIGNFIGAIYGATFGIARGNVVLKRMFLVLSCFGIVSLFAI